MNRTTLLALSLLCLLLLAAQPAAAGLAKAGDALPDLEVKAAPLPGEAAYLGLPAGTKSFRLSQIKAEVLLVEIYSMYCPRCQAEAPAVNRLFERLQAAPEGGRIKFLGIAAGNSDFEVNFFRKKYQAALPLFQDADYALHKGFGAVGTPSYFLLKPAPGGRGFRVLHAQEGQFGDENAFFEQLLRTARLR
jgi:peroxiredoxin